MISEKLRILIVDDDRSYSEELARLIRKRMPAPNLEIFFSDSVNVGIELSKAIIPCVVFLDLMFPNKHWKDAADRIHEFKNNGNPSIVVVTELDDADVEIYCRSCGAIDVFTKSKIRGLIEIIVRVVSNIRLNNLARQRLPVPAFANGST